MPSSREKGFTLIEIMIVVGIIAIIAGIGTMAYLTAMERARQKKSMADIRLIASAWEARASDTRSFLVSGYTFPATDTPFDDLQKALVPTYLRALPRYDGWGNPLEFGAGPDSKHYGIRSPGRDGVFEGDTYEPAITEHLDCDIVYGGGTFVRYPSVAQSK